MSDSDSGSCNTHEADDERDANYAVFRDCLSSVLLQTSVNNTPHTKREPRRRRRAKAHHGNAVEDAEKTPGADTQNSADDLAEFIDYLASGIFHSLPEALKELDYRSWRESEDLQAQFAQPLAPENLSVLDLPPSIPETLVAYNLVAADPTIDSPLPSTTEDFLVPIVTSYIETLNTPPPASWASRTDACEICGRDWIPLSYHHLIPRFVHDKVVKRGWHRKEDLQNVAWLCGACHRFVHHFKNHEELARNYYTVDLLLAEEDVRKFAAWVGRLRWKGGKVRRRVK
ncbi:HNH endonuclease [Pochonia chlamydosporia 170]|uniref:HNH endonuclease n=1 Tax=Pochonia chlamydosporia 170 TaxID=1380566 RepID=A0A179FLF2_METCM|nr:HNH endonuclease [Pochonia chlamydosporia 170]OAQ66466.1 HNH endonuclease [Pochonia chlamydosporia 170]